MDVFPEMSSLTKGFKVLSFSFHQLTTIPHKAIAGLFELLEFSLNNNEIRNFPNISHCKKLTLLRFDQNDISYIPRQHIEGLENIREINFSNNFLMNMTDISQLLSLQTFSIDHNRITVIPGSFIEGLPNMKMFACNNNKLTSLPNILVFFPALERLDVQGNHLETLPDLFEFPSLTILHATEKPFHCNISLCWLRMLQWLKPSVNILQDIPRCDLPVAYAETAVIRFHPTLMECYNGGSLDDGSIILFEMLNIVAYRVANY